MWKQKDRGSLNGNQENGHIYIYGCALQIITTRLISYAFRSSVTSSPTFCGPMAPLSMGFPRQEYWSGLPCSPPGNLSNSGIKSVSPTLAGGFFTTSTTHWLSLGFSELTYRRTWHRTWCIIIQLSVGHDLDTWGEFMCFNTAMCTNSLTSTKNTIFSIFTIFHLHIQYLKIC